MMSTVAFDRFACLLTYLLDWLFLFANQMIDYFTIWLIDSFMVVWCVFVEQVPIVQRARRDELEVMKQFGGDMSKEVRRDTTGSVILEGNITISMLKHDNKPCLLISISLLHMPSRLSGVLFPLVSFSQRLQAIFESDFFERIPRLRRDRSELTKSEFILLVLYLIHKVRSSCWCCAVYATSAAGQVWQLLLLLSSISNFGVWLRKFGVWLLHRLLQPVVIEDIKILLW